MHCPASTGTWNTKELYNTMSNIALEIIESQLTPRTSPRYLGLARNNDLMSMLNVVNGYGNGVRDRAQQSGVLLVITVTERPVTVDSSLAGKKNQHVDRYLQIFTKKKKEKERERECVCVLGRMVQVQPSFTTRVKGVDEGGKRSE